MSLSCHRGMFSSATCKFPLVRRAIPEILSQRTGFFLCGMDEDPFCPFVNDSSISSVSVFCRRRISTAILSKEAQIRASVERTSACRSRWRTWVPARRALITSFTRNYQPRSQGGAAAVPGRVPPRGQPFSPFTLRLYRRANHASY